jgi:hypothetical protein
MADELMDARTYAWNYFAVHAAQRMSVFQFFVTLSTAIVGGAVLIAGSAEDRKWAALLFVLLPFLAFIFWRLDSRTSALIKNAERSLKWIEKNKSRGQDDHDPVALFTNDERTVAGSRAQSPFGHTSYSQSFRYVFIATALLGIVGASAVLLTKSAVQEKDHEPSPASQGPATHGPATHGPAKQGAIAAAQYSRIEIDLPESASFKLNVGPDHECNGADRHGK